MNKEVKVTEESLNASVNTVLESLKKTIKIKDDTQYQLVGSILVESKSYKIQVVNFFKDMKASAYESWQKIVKKEKVYLDKNNEVDKLARSLVVEYEIEQERKREAERAKQILEQEAKKEEAIKESDALAMDGKFEEAEKKIEEFKSPVMTVTPPPPKMEAKITTVKTWYVKSIDKKTLIKSALDDTQWMKFVSVLEGEIKKFINATKGQVAVPGVQIGETKKVINRS